MAPVLAYWTIRGLAQPIRLLLAYVGEEFEDRMYKCGPPPDYSLEPWLKYKFTLGLDFPNLPYFIEGDVKITQSNAILRYLGRKHNLCGRTEAERVRVDVALDQIMDFRNKLTGLVYNPKAESMVPAYVKDLGPKLDAFEKFLGDNKFLAGNTITIPDFHMYEMLDQHKTLIDGCLDGYKNLNAYIKRFEAIPSIKAYMQSPKFMKSPINEVYSNYKAHL